MNRSNDDLMMISGTPLRATSAGRQPQQPAPTYRKPAVFDLGSLEKLQGNMCGGQYDGPSRWYFDGF